MPISKIPPSAMSSGQSIPVTSASTTLHVTSNSAVEQICFVVSNPNSSAQVLSIKEGSTVVVKKEIAARNGEEIIYNTIIKNAAVTLKAVTSSAGILYMRADINKQT